jgi:hypothetical protein
LSLAKLIADRIAKATRDRSEVNLQAKLTVQEQCTHFSEWLQVDKDWHIREFLRAEGLSPGPAVFTYMTLLLKVYCWAKINRVDVVETMENLENWKVTGKEPHPATRDCQDLLHLVDEPSPFEKAWKHLAPQIRRRDRLSKEDSEDVASELIADFYYHLFSTWDAAAIEIQTLRMVQTAAGVSSR